MLSQIARFLLSRSSECSSPVVTGSDNEPTDVKKAKKISRFP